jgi:hypothetical protein
MTKLWTTVGITLAIALAIVAIRTGFVSIHGWDWTIGTDTHYLYIYLPHHAVGYEVAQ